MVIDNRSLMSKVRQAITILKQKKRRIRDGRAGVFLQGGRFNPLLQALY